MTVAGEVNPETGFAANLSEVSAIIQKEIISCVDYKNLNPIVDFMKGEIPTQSVLAMEFFRQISKPIAGLGCRLHLKIQRQKRTGA
ncbi:MAG: 6-carboxytetrahydropterin synthase [Bacteroidia bacterium]